MDIAPITAAISDPEAMGRLTGMAIAALGTGLGVIKCMSLLKRPEVSKLGPVALALVLAGWFTAALGSGAAVIWPEWEKLITGIAAVFMFGLLLGGFVTGIVAIAIFDRARYRHGRGQGLAAVIVGAVLLLIGGAAGVAAFQADVAANVLKSASAKGETHTVEKFNFALTSPPQWATLRPAALNKLACLAFRRSSPDGFVVVIGEHLEGRMTLDGLMEAVKDNLESAAVVKEEGEVEAVTINGTDFLHRNCVVALHSAPEESMYFDQWVAVRPGYSWQISGWGPVAARQKLAADMRALSSSFRVLDEATIAPKEDLVENVERPAWGYRTQLSTKEWKRWTSHGQELADFGALRPLEAIVVMPVDLGARAPDLDAVAAGLLGRLQISYPSEDDWMANPWQTERWGQGLEITGTRTVDDGAYDYVLRVVTKGSLAQLHAGWVHREHGSLEKLRSALDAIELLPPRKPAPEIQDAQRTDMGLVLNDIAIALYNRNEMAAAAPWFKRAFEQTKKDPAVLGNVVDALREAGDSDGALEYLAPHLASFPKHAGLHMHHAYLQSEKGNHEDGHAAFVGALDAGLKDENKIYDWLQHLNEAEAYDVELQSAKAWMDKAPSINSRRWHAVAVSAAGDEEAAVKLLDELAAEAPEDRRVLYDLGETLNSAGEHARAAEVAEKLLADGKEAPRALMILGWSEMGRKWYREAKATFERADRKQPDSEVVASALRRASAMLGQGNNSDIKTPIEPVAMPEAVKQALADHPPRDDYGSDQAFAWLLTSKGYHFEKGKPMRRTWHRRARINTAEGANSLSSIELQFDPLSERIYINRVLVTDGAGKTVTDEAGDAYVMDLDDGVASHRKKLHFQIPGVRPGCTVEYEVTITDLGPASQFTYERHLFGDSAADITFVTGDVDQVAAAEVRTEELQIVRQKQLLAWMGFDMPFDYNEPMAGFYEDRVPGVFLSGKEGTWKQVGSKYLEDIAELLKPDETAADKAAAITAGLTKDRDKIAALTRHVQKEIGYTAIEFGSRARRPNTAVKTLQQQYGDCKDQSLLLQQLLAAAGIKSHLALVNSNWSIQPSLPTLDQFNHMVVQVPALGENWLIDPTDKTLQAEAWHADNLWHSHALILLPDGPKLVAPQGKPAAGSSLVESRRTIKPEEDAWHVDETLTLHGYYGSWMRNAFAGLDARQQLRKAQNMLSAKSAVQIHDFSFPTLTELVEPARIVISYDVPGRIDDDGVGQMRAVLPALWEADYLATSFVKNRRTPFLVRYPFAFRSEVEIRDAKGFSPAALSALTQSATGKFTRWKMSASEDAEGARVEFDFASEPGSHPAEHYQDWHQEWNRSVRAWERPLVWKP